MTTSTLSREGQDSRALQKGALAGLIGGIPFGIMGMMGIMPMIGMLVRVESALAGVLVHAALSAITGDLYGVPAVHYPITWRSNAIVGGLFYGVLWWVLGALILMPALLGMFASILRIGPMQWMSLLGHIIFGEVLALAFVWLFRRGVR